MFTNSYCHWTHTERLAPHEKWRIEEADGIRVVWLRTIPYTGNHWDRGANMLSNVWRSIQVARNLSDTPDVVIGPSVPLGTGWAAAQIAKIKGAAFVFEVRDVWPISLVYNGALSKRSPVYYIFRLIEKYLYSKSRRICATMPLLSQHVAESGGDPGKVVWIPNGVNLDSYSGFETYDGGRTFPLVAMYVGAFGNAHDVVTIVRAARILQQKGNNNYRFVIVGNGIKRAECEREASLYGLSNVDFRNPVAKADIPRLQSQSDILIACVTDSNTYQFGINLNKLYGYFASGRPVIFSGNAPNDPVKQSGAGFSIAPQDPSAMASALERYLAMEPTERIELGRRARLYAEEKFDIRKLAGRMELLLWQAIQSEEALRAA